MRRQIRSEVATITPLDEREERNQQEVLSWIDSGQVLCRLEKPATPNKHLVSYFAVVDGDYLLLVDHIKAQLWLPTGGHVEPGEHPKTTVIREAQEELGIEAKFLVEKPLLLTSTTTVGKTAGHVDVSLWYVLEGDRHKALDFDRSEFLEVRWFHKRELPQGRMDPEMMRFVEKLNCLQASVG